MTKNNIKDLNYYKELDKKLKMIPLTNPLVLEKAFTKNKEVLKEFLLAALDLTAYKKGSSITTENIEIPESNENLETFNIYVLLNHVLDAALHLDKSYFKDAPLSHLVAYGAKIHDLAYKRCQEIQKNGAVRFTLLNIKPKEDTKEKDDIGFLCETKTKKIDFEDTFAVIKNPNYYKKLYDSGQKDEETIWTAAFAAKTFEELYTILSHTLNNQELNKFISEVENASLTIKNIVSDNDDIDTIRKQTGLSQEEIESLK